MFMAAFWWLLAPTPLWLSLCLVAACATLAWQFYALQRRVDRHARSIAHMDDWADNVEHALRQIEGRAWRLQPAATDPRPLADTRKWWQT